MNGASYALLAVRAGTSYAGFRVPRDRDAGKVLEELRKGLDGLQKAGRDYEGARKDHVTDYQALYNRVDLDLGTELSGNLPTTQRLHFCGEGVDDPSLAALMLQYSRYLTIAGSRPGSQALNLQGIWNDTPIRPGPAIIPTISM